MLLSPLPEPPAGAAMKGRQVCLVTGGRGFLARHLVLRLIDEDRWIVRIADLAPAPALSAEEEEGPLGRAIRTGTAEYVPLDVRDTEQVARCCRGAAAVFHLAAASSALDDRLVHESVTVGGTQNVVDACRRCGVRRLVYTSSPCVVMERGAPALVDADESLPIASCFNDVYSEMKARAEALVLRANDRRRRRRAEGEGGGGLLTCAVRPFGIYGPGDRLALPAFVAGARSWQMKFVLGDGRNLFDWTYVENVAHAHVCAERALDDVGSQLQAGAESEDEEVSGQAYFITDGRPQRFWQFVGDFLSGLGYPRPRLHLPTSLLLPAAHVAAWFSRTTGIGAGHHFTPSRVRLVTSTCTFDISRARQRLGYEPPVPFDEAMRRTVASFAHQRAPTPAATVTTTPDHRYRTAGFIWTGWLSACVSTAVSGARAASMFWSSLSGCKPPKEVDVICVLLFALYTCLDLCALPQVSVATAPQALEW